jgi:hypothetical protein
MDMPEMPWDNSLPPEETSTPQQQSQSGTGSQSQSEDREGVFKAKVTIQSFTEMQGKYGPWYKVITTAGKNIACFKSDFFDSIKNSQANQTPLSVTIEGKRSPDGKYINYQIKEIEGVVVQKKGGGFRPAGPMFTDKQIIGIIAGIIIHGSFTPELYENVYDHIKNKFNKEG